MGSPKSQTLTFTFTGHDLPLCLGLSFPSFLCMSDYKFLLKSMLMSHMIYEAFSKCPNPDSHELLRNDRYIFIGMWTIWLCFLSRLFIWITKWSQFSLCKCSYFEYWAFIHHNSSCHLIYFFTDSRNTQFKRFLLFQCIIFKITFTQEITFSWKCAPELKSRSKNCNKDNHSFLESETTTRLGVTWNPHFLFVWSYLYQTIHPIWGREICFVCT